MSALTTAQDVSDLKNLQEKERGEAKKGGEIALHIEENVNAQITRVYYLLA